MVAKQLRPFGVVLIGLAAFILITRGVTGPLTGLLLYGMLVVGTASYLAAEAIALRDWLRRRNDPSASTDRPEPASPEHVPQQKGTGYPTEQGRRLLGLLILAVLFALIAAILTGTWWRPG